MYLEDYLEELSIVSENEHSLWALGLGDNFVFFLGYDISTISRFFLTLGCSSNGGFCYTDSSGLVRLQIDPFTEGGSFVVPSTHENLLRQELGLAHLEKQRKVGGYVSSVTLHPEVGVDNRSLYIPAMGRVIRDISYWILQERIQACLPRSAAPSFTYNEGLFDWDYDRIVYNDP